MVSKLISQYVDCEQFHAEGERAELEVREGDVYAHAKVLTRLICLFHQAGSFRNQLWEFNNDNTA